MQPFRAASARVAAHRGGGGAGQPSRQRAGRNERVAWGTGAPYRSPARDARTQIAPSLGMERSNGTLLHAQFENREDRTAGAACGVWNMIESGDYSITKFVSGK